jgi:hypothetical protein
VPEALRVLRPGGALALWWNTEALDVPWIEAAARRTERFFGIDQVVDRNSSGARAALSFAAASGSASPSASGGRLSFDRRHVRWSRRVPIDMRLANIGSHSAFLVLGEEATGAFFAEERDHLLQVFPEGSVEETYVVDLLVATRS